MAARGSGFPPILGPLSCGGQEAACGFRED